MKFDIFLASNNPFPPQPLSKEAQNTLYVMGGTDIVRFAVDGDSILPMLEKESHLRLWDFKYIIHLD